MPPIYISSNCEEILIEENTPSCPSPPNPDCAVSVLPTTLYYDCSGTIPYLKDCSQSAINGYTSTAYECIVQLTGCNTLDGSFVCAQPPTLDTLYYCASDPNGASDLTTTGCLFPGDTLTPSGFLVYQCAIASSVETNYRCRKLLGQIVGCQSSGNPASTTCVPGTSYHSYCYSDPDTQTNLFCFENAQSTKTQFTGCTLTPPYNDWIASCGSGGTSTLYCYVANGLLFECSDTP